MRAPRTPRFRKLTALIGTGVIACTTLAACGGESGTPTVNVYGSTSDAGFDKILADWNGLTITALANAGAAFKNGEWVSHGIAAFDFVVKVLGKLPAGAGPVSNTACVWSPRLICGRSSL